MFYSQPWNHVTAKTLRKSQDWLFSSSTRSICNSEVFKMNYETTYLFSICIHLEFFVLQFKFGDASIHSKKRRRYKVLSTACWFPGSLIFPTLISHRGHTWLMNLVFLALTSLDVRISFTHCYLLHLTASFYRQKPNHFCQGYFHYSLQFCGIVRLLHSLELGSLPIFHFSIYIQVNQMISWNASICVISLNTFLCRIAQSSYTFMYADNKIYKYTCKLSSRRWCLKLDFPNKIRKAWNYRPRSKWRCVLNCVIRLLLHVHSLCPQQLHLGEEAVTLQFQGNIIGK